jgi:peptidoglycan/xylan/chitin deacetylase (PgdA/CDA1 family)
MSRVFPLWVKTPHCIRALAPDVLWQMPSSEKKLYLTFDDGPVPEVTSFVLEQLKKHRAKATFFCIGDNVRKHPDVFREVLDDGHTIGNHTIHHISGWQLSEEVYLEEVASCEKELKTAKNKENENGIDTGTKLFRPPYGKLKPSQYKKLKAQYQIVLWDVLSYDFDVNISGETVAENIINNAESGSIVVLHDSAKAFPRLKIALPKVLEHFSENGWKFESITQSV